MPDSAGPSGNFLNKPRRWLHPDQHIMKSGVIYAVRYVGCLDVHTSMKTLDFDARFQIAKECINQVCEAAGLKTVDRKRKISKQVLRAIGSRPNMRHAGLNVKLSISSTCLALKLHENDRIIVMHDMPRISFASGGDAETLDFVAYVAKDSNNWRACFVLECGGGLAQDVITTIGQAFDLRFKQFLNRPLIEPLSKIDRDRDYYNDMPGKVPPDVSCPPVPPLPNLNNKQATRERLPSTNLIDLNCEVVAPRACQSRTHDYINDMVTNETKSSQPRDVFDMQPFPHTEIEDRCNCLHDEIWFHGSISRQQAEALLKQDGDFLVRESQGSPGQYVLTGTQGGIKKHLLLIDPEGVVS